MVPVTIPKKHIAIVVVGVVALVTLAYGPRVMIIEALQTKPASFSLPIPFTTQAPDGNWNNNEDCEEASAIMAKAYLNGDTADELDASAALQSINTLVAWEQLHLGHNANTGADDIARMVGEVFNLKTAQLNNFTANDLKRELLRKHVVLLPINAQLLGNAQYQDGGRLYHVVVVRGYTPAGFVVNDPGTTDGKNNVYTFTTLQKAAADWDSINRTLVPGEKIALSIWK